MKISDLYKLPMITENDCILDHSCRYKIDFDTSDSNCKEQIQAVSVAINNHDALVEALADLVANSSPKANMQYHSRRKTAVDLLNKIKGDSNESK